MYIKLFIVSCLCVLLAIYFDRTSVYTLFKSLISSSSTLTAQKPQTRLFTSEELKLYNGNDKPELYLAILGQVFDVSKGVAHYGHGQSYNFFIGRDGSRGFITGQFNNNKASDQVADLAPEELRSLNYWVQFYKKEYKRVGRLIGRYYNEDGKLTQYGKEVKKLMKVAEQALQDNNLEKLKYPPCNVEWEPSKGSRVWCTNRSGGIDRDWVGVPRMLYEPGSQNYRCACVSSDHLSLANLKQYDGCDSESESCFVKS